MRVVIAALAVLATPALGQAPRARVSLPAYRAPVVLDTLAIREEFSAAPGAVHSALVVAVTEMGLEPTVRDSLRGIVSNPELVTFRRLAGKAMSFWLDCGIGMTGRYADTHRVTLAWAALLDPLPDGRTRVGIGVSGSAIERGGTTNTAVQCNTTGALEAAITERVRKTLGG
jgi:hypothetical protein